MIVLDINKYAVTKLAIRIMLLKYPSAGKCWHLALHVLYILYVSTAEMFYLLHCNQYFTKKTTSSQMIEVV